MKKTTLKNEIIKKIGIYKSMVKSNTQLNRCTINTDSEDFIKELLNLSFGFNLKNINEYKKNYSSIDLFDDENKICVQVTSSNEKEKITDTVNGYFKKKYYERWNEIWIFIIGDKKTYKTIPSNELYTLEIIDLNDYLHRINYLPTEKLTEIKLFLNNELGLEDLDKPDIFKVEEIEECKTGQNYFDWIVDKYGVDEKRIEKKEFFEFLEKLKSINKTNRKFINQIIKINKSKREDTIVFDMQDLKEDYQKDLQEFNCICSSLIEEGLIVLREEHYYDTIAILKDFRNIQELTWVGLREYCDDKNINIEEIIINLKFSYFDK